jgi:hypothetical protein
MNVLHCSNLLSVDINCIRSVAAVLSMVPFQSGFQLGAKRVGVERLLPLCAQTCCNVCSAGREADDGNIKYMILYNIMIYGMI